ncbi:MAG: SDR family NAD(P)-dependent oxidoreductase [Rhodothermales bacterium]
MPEPLIDLTDRVAIVTGGGKGIGGAISKRLASLGAQVAVFEVDESAAASVVAEICEADGTAQAITCDVSNTASVAAAFEKTASVLGPPTVLVNNAGVAHIGTAETTEEADFDRVYAVNVKGVFLCTQAAIPHMREAGGGSIVNIASIAGMLGLPERFAYSATKGAVLAMTYTTARDFLANNIRCNSVSPARVHTPFVDGYLARTYPGREAEMFEHFAQTQPIGRMGTPDEIATLVAYLASDASAFMTGTNVPIDGGFVRLNT